MEDVRFCQNDQFGAFWLKKFFKKIAQNENQNAFFPKIKDGSDLVYFKLFHSSGESGIL